MRRVALLSWPSGRDGGGRQEERAVEDQTLEPGVETSITDELDSDLDLIAGTKKSSQGDGYIEQD